MGSTLKLRDFPLGDGFVVHGVWDPLKPYDLFDSLEEELCNYKCLCVYRYGILLFGEPTFTHCFMIPMVNHCVKPWKGVYMFCKDMLYTLLVLECNLFEPCFCYSVGGFLEA